MGAHFADEARRSARQLPGGQVMRRYSVGFALLIFFSAAAQEPSLPREQWLANLKPGLSNYFCSDGSAFRQVYKGDAAACPGTVQSLFEKCTTTVPEVRIPETIVGFSQGNKYGSIIGECMSAHYMGGAVLQAFNAMQDVTNAAAVAPAAASAADTCASAPTQAIVRLDEPHARWFAIQCDPQQKSHFLVPGAGYEWTEQTTGRAYRFNAYGPISPLPGSQSEGGTHTNYFVKAVPSVMTRQQLADVNQLLPPGTDAYGVIHQLDLNTSTGLIYSFFLYLRDETPEWIVACVNYDCGRRAIVRVGKQ